LSRSFADNTSSYIGRLVDETQNRTRFFACSWDGSQYVDTFVALKKLGACTSLKTAESLFYTLIQRFKNKIFF
jgi:hypothetical protein